MRHIGIVTVVLIASMAGLVYRSAAQSPAPETASNPTAPVPSKETPPTPSSPFPVPPKTMKAPVADMTWGPSGTVSLKQTPKQPSTAPETFGHPAAPSHLPAMDAPPQPKPSALPIMRTEPQAADQAGPTLSGPSLDSPVQSAPVFTPPSATDLLMPPAAQPASNASVPPAQSTNTPMSVPTPVVTRTAAPIVLTGAQTPTVHLEKIGPATVSVGKPLVYEIVARNAGTATVCNVRVEDQLPTGAHYLSAEPRPDVHSDHLVWNIGNLEAGSERRIRVEIQPTGEGELTSNATVTFSASSGLKTQITRPKITLTQTCPETVQVGDATTFQIQIANVGSGAATSLVLHANLPTGLWHEKGVKIDADLGALAPGESRTVPLTTTATRAGKQGNEITITGDDGVQAVSQAAVLVTEPILTLRATGPRRRYLNRETQFNLEVANAGSGRAANVYVCDVLPEGLEFTSASEGGTYDPASRAVAWQIGVLTPGQRQSLSVKATAKSLGTLVNRAIVRDERGLETKVETPVSVEGLTGLFLEVVDLEDAATVGSAVAYEIRVLNQGTAPNTGIHLVAHVPVGMSVKTVTGPAAHRVQGQQVIFEPLPTLAPRADAVYCLAVHTQQPGDMRLKVQLASDQVKTPITKEESTHVYADSDELVTSTSSGTWKPDAPKPAGGPDNP